MLVGLVNRIWAESLPGPPVGAARIRAFCLD
jgi:hypothetical protein